MLDNQEPTRVGIAQVASDEAQPEATLTSTQGEIPIAVHPASINIDALAAAKDASARASAYHEEAIKVLLPLARMQAAVNAKQGGADWIARTLSGQMDQLMAAFDEMAEFQKSFVPYVWWKPTPENDVMNAQVELVDVLHFVLGYEIAHASTFQYSEEMHGVPDAFTSAASRIAAGYAIYMGDKHLLQTNVRQAFKDFTASLLQGHPRYRHFFELVDATGMTLKHLSTYYIGKSALNRFRSDNGYKQNQYQKIWAGEEDNAHMMRWIDGIVRATGGSAEITSDDVYAWLQATYPVFKG
jgi:hypothetical protein